MFNKNMWCVTHRYGEDNYKKYVSLTPRLIGHFFSGQSKAMGWQEISHNIDPEIVIKILQPNFCKFLNTNLRNKFKFST
jgi:hypothetical protein